MKMIIMMKIYDHKFNMEIINTVQEDVIQALQSANSIAISCTMWSPGMAGYYFISLQEAADMGQESPSTESITVIIPAR